MIQIAPPCVALGAGCKVKCVGVAQAHAVAEHQRPQAVKCDFRAPGVAQNIDEASGVLIERGDLSCTAEITCLQAVGMQPEIRRCTSYNPRRGEATEIIERVTLLRTNANDGMSATPPVASAANINSRRTFDVIDVGSGVTYCADSTDAPNKLRIYNNTTYSH